MMQQVTLTMNDRTILQLIGEVYQEDILKLLGNGDKKTLASVWGCPQDITLPLTETEIKTLSGLIDSYINDLLGKLDGGIIKAPYNVYSKQPDKEPIKKSRIKNERQDRPEPLLEKSINVEIDYNNGYFAFHTAKNKYLHYDGKWRSTIKHNGIKSGIFSYIEEVKDILNEKGLEYRVVTP